LASSLIRLQAQARVSKEYLSWSKVAYCLSLEWLLFCSCGRAMTGCKAKSGQYHYYVFSRSYKQGKDSCDARLLPQQKLEHLVIEQVREKILVQEYLEELVELVNGELSSAHEKLKDRLDVIDAESKDVYVKLSNLYAALETGKLNLDDLAPRIKELRARQDELNKARIKVEADIVVQGVEQVDAELVKSYAEDLRALLEEAKITDSKAFLRSLIKRIEVNNKQVKLLFNLPIPHDGERMKKTEVLSIDTLGGAWGTRTPNL
jgi:site-specific DNA recombinase